MSTKSAFCDNLEDRISNLPGNLINCILERMSIRNAARTSILSKKWRQNWYTHPQLMLNYPFLYGPERQNVPWTASEYVKVINQILIVHNGTIQKFNLQIPFAQSPETDLWILILSRNGIKELTLYNAYSQPYKLPYYLFSCAKLTYLQLFNFIISVPPPEFRGFPNLNKLLLQKISLSPMIGSLISTLPVLHDLYIKSCTGLENLKVMPPKLNWFDVMDSHEFLWQCLKISNSNLKVLYVELCKEVEQQKDFSLMVLLGNITKITTLWLDGFSLKISKFTNDNGVQQVLNYMEASGNFDIEGLNGLQTVELKSCISKAALQFAKLLLSRSPSLKRMTIDNRSRSVKAKEQLRISMELMRFPRASTKAELIYLL